MKKVDFFIVGAPKAGTTSLYHYLNEHPDIDMSSQKEPDFFSYRYLQKQNLYYGKKRIDTIDKYHSLFKRDNIKLRGEASVSYLFYEDVPQRIIKYNPNAKIIIMLRNPIERAFSHYLMDYRLGLISENFDAIIKSELKSSYNNLFYQQYILISEYALQVKRYLSAFPKKNIHFIYYEDFKENTNIIVSKVFLFLGIDDGFTPSLQKKYNIYSQPKIRIIHYLYSFFYLRRVLSIIFPKILINRIRKAFFRSDIKPELSESSRRILKRHFESDVKELSKILNKDLVKWIR